MCLPPLHSLFFSAPIFFQCRLLLLLLLLVLLLWHQTEEEDEGRLEEEEESTSLWGTRESERESRPSSVGVRIEGREGGKD